MVKLLNRIPKILMYIEIQDSPSYTNMISIFLTIQARTKNTKRRVEKSMVRLHVRYCWPGAWGSAAESPAFGVTRKYHRNR